MSTETLLAKMRQNPTLRLSCVWGEGFGRNRWQPKLWDAGGWGFFGCGGVIGTTADVRELLASGHIRPVGPHKLHESNVQWGEYVLAETPALPCEMPKPAPPSALRPYLRELHGSPRSATEASIAYGEPHPLGPDWDDAVYLGTYATRAEAEAICARYLAASPGTVVNLDNGYTIVRGNG